jgi:hypothetical protein
MKPNNVRDHSKTNIFSMDTVKEWKERGLLRELKWEMKGTSIWTAKILLDIPSDNKWYMARKRLEQGFRFGSVRRL